MSARQSVLGWAAGAVAGLGLIAVADLTAWILIPEAPPLAVLAAAVERLPTSPDGADAIASYVTTHPLYVAITGIVVVALAAGAGALELRRRWSGIFIFAALAVVGVVATVLTFPGWFNSLLPMIAGPVAGYVILFLLIKRINRYLTTAADLARIQDLHPLQPQGTQGRSASADGPTKPLDLSHQIAVQRRSVVRTIGVVGAATATATVAGEALLTSARTAARARAEIQLPLPAAPAPAPPAGADLDLKGLSPYVTPTNAFYRIDTALQVPQIGANDWTLTISGLVRNKITISYEQLLARDLVEHFGTLVCKANPVGANPIAGNLVGTARWLGLPVRELLAEAEPQPGADMVLSTSQDGWSAGTPLMVLLDPDRQSLLAVGMNGKPLPPEHGFPVRLVVPGLYGDVSATKWVVDLKVTTFSADRGYWTPLGWSPTGVVKIASRIDIPAATTIEPGPVTVAGVAYAPHIGIDQVQLRIDDEPWQDAVLGTTTGPDTWRQWHLDWDATPGTHELMVRATDSNGQLQTQHVHEPAPSGATGWHTVTVRVRRP
jgi:DMSO/TMAO reductase YedYZ molybdopterin-dependent catalytic subunit